MEFSEILKRYRHCKSASLSQVFFKDVSNEREYFELKCTANPLGIRVPLSGDFFIPSDLTVGEVFCHSQLFNEQEPD